MAESPEKPTADASRAIYVYWGSAYFVAVAVLYLWGYWSVFGINILEYVGLSDVAKTAAYPVASTFLAFALGVVIGEVFFPQGMFPSGGGVDTPKGRTLNRFGAHLFAIYAIGTTSLYLFGPSEKWRVLPFLVGPPVALVLKRVGFLAKMLPSDSARTITLFLLSTLPLFAYGHGHLKGLALRQGTAFLYAISPIEGLRAPATPTAMNLPRYIGFAGEHVFFYEPTSNSVSITSVSHAKVIRLNAYADESSQKPNSTPSQASSPASGP